MHRTIKDFEYITKYLGIYKNTTNNKVYFTNSIMTKYYEPEYYNVTCGIRPYTPILFEYFLWMYKLRRSYSVK